MAKYNLDKYTSADGLGFPLNFRRGNPNPLDNSSVHSSLAAAQTYAATDPTAYVGQILTVVTTAEDSTTSVIAYSIQDEAGTLKEIGSVPLGDGLTIEVVDGEIALKGASTAKEGAQPRIKADGSIEWIVPSTETVEGLQATVAALQSDVTTLETKMDGTGEGSVDAKINAKINEFATNVTDDGVVNSYKELIDYVASHGKEAADMAADITALQGLVGGTSVSDQISTAIAGKVDAEEGKGLSSNDFTDSLLAKLNGIEEGAQINVIESISMGGTLLEITEKSVNIPVATADALGVVKGSDEVTVASDGALGVAQVSVSKLVQESDVTLVLDGGAAS